MLLNFRSRYITPLRFAQKHLANAIRQLLPDFAPLANFDCLGRGERLCNGWAASHHREVVVRDVRNDEVDEPHMA